MAKESYNELFYGINYDNHIDNWRYQDSNNNIILY